MEQWTDRDQILRVAKEKIARLENVIDFEREQNANLEHKLAKHSAQKEFVDFEKLQESIDAMKARYKRLRKQ